MGRKGGVGKGVGYRNTTEGEVRDQCLGNNSYIDVPETVNVLMVGCT